MTQEPIVETDHEKEPKQVSNRGFIVDLIFNFPQGVAVDKESYITEIINHMAGAYEAGEKKQGFHDWLKQPKKK